MNAYAWYQQLSKPPWAPPGWIFGPAWTVLYAIIAASYGYVGYLFFKGRLPFVVALPFMLNLVFNFAFTPLQFGVRNNLLAAVDVLLVLATLIWALVAVWPHARWVVYANIPHVLWVCFATVLQFTITYLNP